MSGTSRLIEQTIKIGPAVCDKRNRGTKHVIVVKEKGSEFSFSYTLRCKDTGNQKIGIRIIHYDQFLQKATIQFCTKTRRASSLASASPPFNAPLHQCKDEKFLVFREQVCVASPKKTWSTTYSNGPTVSGARNNGGDVIMEKGKAEGLMMEEKEAEERFVVGDESYFYKELTDTSPIHY